MKYSIFILLVLLISCKSAVVMTSNIGSKEIKKEIIFDTIQTILKPIIIVSKDSIKISIDTVLNSVVTHIDSFKTYYTIKKDSIKILYTYPDSVLKFNLKSQIDTIYKTVEKQTNIEYQKLEWYEQPALIVGLVALLLGIFKITDIIKYFKTIKKVI